MILRESFIYSLATFEIEKNMSENELGQCDNCQLERQLYGGICEDCDSEYFAEFWQGDSE